MFFCLFVFFTFLTVWGPLFSSGKVDFQDASSVGCFESLKKQFLYPNLDAAARAEQTLVYA